MSKKTVISIRSALIQALEAGTGDTVLAELLPELPDATDLSIIADTLEYPALALSPVEQWPEPMGMSIVYGETQGLLFDISTGVAPASYVHGFTRGGATVATILTATARAQLQLIVQGVVPPIAIGDNPLPDIAPWLIEKLLESASNIIKKTGNYNLRDVLAYNYGIFWATAAIVPPKPDDLQKDALAWVERVVEYYGSLGIVPN